MIRSAASTYRQQFDRYTDGVLSGDILAGDLVRLAVERHMDDLSAGIYEFNWAKAERALKFIGALQHTTGEFAGQPFSLRDWQVFGIASIFGWLKDDGTRRFREVYWSVGRGNGKSPIAAAIGNYMLLADNEPRAEVYCAATESKQARIVFDESKRFIRTNEYLDARLLVAKDNISDPVTFSKFEPLTRGAKSGFVTHLAILDEIHEWRDLHKEFYDTIETSMSKRRQPLMMVITTAGDDDSALWEEKYDTARKVLRRVMDDDALFALCYEIDDEDDPLDAEMWPKANPMMQEAGSPVKIDGILRLAEKAKASTDAMRRLKRYHCNKQVVSFWQFLRPEIWQLGDRPTEPLDGRECYAGFDWGWRKDLAALVYVFPRGSGDEQEYDWFCRAWIPSRTERDLSRSPWAEWIADGFLTVTDGDTTDIDAIYKALEDDSRRFSILKLAGDPHNCREFLTRCNNQWGIETYDHLQSCGAYNEPMRHLDKAATQGRIVHGGNPLLAWCADNLTVKENATGYIMPTKNKSKDKIDPMVAGIMAQGLAVDYVQYDCGPVFV